MVSTTTLNTGASLPQVTERIRASAIPPINEKMGFLFIERDLFWAQGECSHKQIITHILTIFRVEQVKYRVI
jgi:hypothetical protein